MRRMDLLIGGLLVLLIGGPAIGTALRMQDRQQVSNCANNLSQLWKMQNNYMVQYGGAQKMMPEETGDAFWLKLSTPPTELIDESLADIYQCPVEDFEDKGCDYRGPAFNVNKYKDGDPVGADVIGNHGTGRGGNVLRKSGDVQTVSENDALWTLAQTKTVGGNKAHPPKIYKAPSKLTSKQRKALVHIGHIYTGMYMYRRFNEGYPESLAQLIERPKDDKTWPEGGYLVDGKLPKDPWGRAYQYEPRGKKEPRIWTFGADGKKGGEGDNYDLSFLYLAQMSEVTAAELKGIEKAKAFIHELDRFIRRKIKDGEITNEQELSKAIFDFVGRNRKRLRELENEGKKMSDEEKKTMKEYYENYNAQWKKAIKK